VEELWMEFIFYREKNNLVEPFVTEPKTRHTEKLAVVDITYQR
jgi:hypothetical protein